MEKVIFDITSASVLTVCGVCTLYTGILRRKKRKAGNIFTAILILCAITFAVSPYIRPIDITLPPTESNGYVIFAFSYAALTLLYIALYQLSFKKTTDNMQKLVFGSSVFIALIMLLSAAIPIVKLTFGLFLMIPKY